MSEQNVDAVHRRAAVVSRRGTLLTMGGAGLVTLARSPIIEAKKSDKKATRKARQKGKKKCRKQVDQCTGAFVEICADQEDPAGCEAEIAPCCAFLAGCQATAFFTCVVANGA